ERLMARVAPVGPAAAVDEFDTDRSRIPAVAMVRDTGVRHESMDRAIAVDVQVAAVAGLRARMLDAFGVFARQCHVRQFRAMDHDEIDVRGIACLEARLIGHGPGLDHAPGPAAATNDAAASGQITN